MYRNFWICFKLRKCEIKLNKFKYNSITFAPYSKGLSGLNLINSNITGNTADYGILLIYSSTITLDNVKIKNNEITPNKNKEKYQDGVLMIEQTIATLNNVLFENNIGENASCINSINTKLTITNSNLTDNYAKDQGIISYVADSRFDVSINLTNINIKNNIVLNNSQNIGTGIVYIEDSKGTINNVLFENNTAYVGGGIYLKNSQITLTNSNFMANRAFIDGIVYVNSSSTIKLKNVTFKKNKLINSEDLWGSGIILLINSEGTLDNGLFENNEALISGGVLLTKSNMNITKSKFIKNNVSQAGAIYAEYSKLRVLESEFIENIAQTFAGALFICQSSVIIDKCNFTKNTISNNYIGVGGAILNLNGYYSNITNSVFNENSINTVYGFGSSIANRGVLNLNNVTIQNSALNTKNNITETIYDMGGYVTIKNSNISTTSSKGNETNIYMLDSAVLFGNLTYKNTTLPESYDLREQGRLTPVKNQEECGSCWSFATTAMLESRLLTEGEYYILSENNLKNLMTNESSTGYDIYFSNGGWNLLAVAYWARWSGPVNNSDDPYNETSGKSPENITPTKHVQNIVYLPQFKTAEDLKLAILNYGAISIKINSGEKDGAYYQYSDQPTSLNHYVLLVGWDDNIPASKFGENVPGNGGFIIKNSWGVNATLENGTVVPIGDDGYYYISYYDYQITKDLFDSNIVMLSTEDTNNYKSNYQYDPLGTLSSIGFNNETAWFANQFTSNSTEKLAAFSLYTYAINSTYEATIYVNNKKVSTEKGTISNPGYNTIKLNKNIILHVGDVFKIEVKLTTPGCLYPIAIETNISGVTSKATAKLNQSFISNDGINWYDIAQDTNVLRVSTNPANVMFYTLNNTNVCLKAFTSEISTSEVISTGNLEVYYKNGTPFTATIFEGLGTPAVGESVTFIINGAPNIRTTDKNGVAILRLGLSPGKYLVITQYKDLIQYNNLTILPTISGNNTELYYRNGTAYTVKVVDKQGKAVTNQKVKFNINGVFYEKTTDSKGIATLRIGLSPGKYIVTAENLANGEKTSNNITVKSLMESKDLEMYWRNGSSYTVKVLDGKGNPLAGATVKFNINGVYYTRTTDANGIATLRIGLSPGKYVITAEYNGFMQSNKITVKPILIGKDITLHYRDGTAYKVQALNSQGKPLEGAKITFNINGVYYTRTTDANGIVSLRIGLSPYDNYIITAEYNGFMTSNKIVVKP